MEVGSVRLLTPKHIPSLVKDAELIAYRRRQLARVASKVFAKDGFHRTTVRKLARASKLSVGTIYEYVKTKQDILYLVAEYVLEDIGAKIREAVVHAASPVEALKSALREFFRIVDRDQDNFLMVYRETKALDPRGKELVLGGEETVARIFEEILQDGIKAGVFRKMETHLISHNIIMLGHMWALRRWALRRKYGVEEFIQTQIDFILHSIRSEWARA